MQRINLHWTTVMIAAVSLALPMPVHAGSISLGSAVNYAVLGLAGNSTVINSAVTITGNEGISQGGSISNNAPSTVTGNVYEYSSGQFSGPGAVGGSVIVSPSTLTQNDSDVNTALTEISNSFGPSDVNATQTLSGVTSSTTINGNGGLNLIQVNGSINLNGQNLTLSGSSSDYFVIDVTGSLKLAGTAALNLGGGVTTNHVIYDFTGSSANTIQTDVGDNVYGTLLAPNLAMTLDGHFYGELIGAQSILLQSNMSVVGTGNGFTPYTPPPATPEPATLTLLGCGISALMVARRQFKKA